MGCRDGRVDFWQHVAGIMVLPFDIGPVQNAIAAAHLRNA
jgi:hypothetical protein